MADCSTCGRPLNGAPETDAEKPRHFPGATSCCAAILARGYCPECFLSTEYLELDTLARAHALAAVSDEEFEDGALAEMAQLRRPELLPPFVAASPPPAGDFYPRNIHLHLGGKTGELIYASGIFPAVRASYPGSRLILYLHPHYVPVVEGLRYQPDDVVAYEVPDDRRLLAQQVTDCLRREYRRLGVGLSGPTTFAHGNDLHACLYAMHYRPVECGREPFYRLFQLAAGVGGLAYTVPSWKGVQWWPNNIALVFPTANIHAGSAIRSLCLSPSRWERAAEILRDRGLEPFATGHVDDGRPEMPGWTWIAADEVTDVLELLAHTELVLGFNSGIMWAAYLLSPGRVHMLDGQNRSEYLLDRFSHVLDLGRCSQEPAMPRLRARAWRALTRTAGGA